jgi:hypothetical protein
MGRSNYLYKIKIVSTIILWGIRNNIIFLENINNAFKPELLGNKSLVKMRLSKMKNRPWRGRFFYADVLNNMNYFFNIESSTFSLDISFVQKNQS